MAVNWLPFDRERRAVWHPIETAPKDVDAIFWCRMLEPGEPGYVDLDSGALFLGAEPFVFIGRFSTWSSLMKATHWMPLPEPPT
jgi:hypothetical protein